jgi:hypothetical protein
MHRALTITALALVGAFSEAAGSAETPRECCFTYRPLAVGDEARETVDFALTLKTIRSQAGQVIDMADQAVERNERSHVVRLPAGPGQTAKARITYESARQTSQVRGGTPAETERPVAGRTYIAARQGDDLVISDEQGQEPPEEELTIVARSMAGLGRPSPLGLFFDGRAVAMGQSVRLPAEFTAELLAGWDEALARLPLDVILMGVEHVDGQLCALLHTPPSGTSETGTRRAPVEGKFLVELATCRVALVELRGPINASERRGQPGSEFDVRRRGKLQVAVHVEHQRAAR